MPPRSVLLQCLRVQNALPGISRPRSFTTSSSVGASTAAQRKRHRDPYAIAQAKAKKAANTSRQEVLQKERAVAMGDPVRGITTPYVESFDTATRTGASTQSAGEDDRLNFFLSKSDLDHGLERSRWLTSPSSDHIETDADFFTAEQSPEQRRAEVEDEQANAAEAIRLITNLSLGSSKDRLRVNKQRCVADFGRHNTDSILPPRPQQTNAKKQPEKMGRAGPDTGSSEVQIAILTAKIRTLADFLETRGTMDKVNKRNLRLLVHRRQKLLQYLRRKERGGPRWQNIIETLGLTEGTWRGEISM